VTAWGYLANSGDRRLASINNTGLATSQFSNYTFTTTPEKFIAAIGETSDSTIVYPGTLTQTASYNNLNQLTLLSGQALTFDAAGNLTSDGTRNYTWDAENRLVGITYPGQTGKATAFTYDGLSRRVSIASTPTGGGSTVTTSYLWCGTRICQARNAGNSPTRGYYDEGEVVPGSPAQPYYYGVDQLGSVRRAFASTTSAPAFSYDPYGKPLQGTSPVTDFNYAGMFYNSDSGLYLTQYRVYDPVLGRWLSRDPLGEMSNGFDSLSSTILFEVLGSRKAFDNNPSSETNLYGYVNGAPIIYIDPTGELTRKQAEAFFRACMLAWRWLSGNPEVQVPPVIPRTPPIERPYTPIPRTPPEPPAGPQPPPSGGPQPSPSGGPQPPAQGPKPPPTSKP
jgi:RHS repeat-associated protein